jgi:oligogalacturonide lyase
MSTSKIGARWPSEKKTYTDPMSGATIHQLTDYLCTSNHAYFTNPCWYDGGRKLMFMSDRGNRINYFGMELDSGEITQLTDLDPCHGALNPQSLSKNPAREEAYFFQGKTLFALDLQALNTRPIYTAPDGYFTEVVNGTADGCFACAGLYQDLSDRFAVDLDHGYVGFHEYWEARPHSMIVKVALDGGGSSVAFEQDYWIGHVNTSSKLPHILTFCHEGPWQQVDNRIWGLNIDTGETWKIRPSAPGERIGHEYWMVDGEHIGYHGHTAQGPVYGAIRYDNTDQVEAIFPDDSTHFSSLSLDLIVGDGWRDNPYVMLWRFRDGRFEGPKVLAWHRGSFHIQRVHVHPLFGPDGKSVVFTADPQGYGQVFMVEVPEFDALPDRGSVA